MNRYLALIAAVVFAFITISSACTAAGTGPVRFALTPERGGDEVHATFRHQAEGRDENDWSSDFRASELVGFDLDGFQAAGTRSVNFALVREAGRLDCSGQGGGFRASGNCRFTPDPAFVQFLETRGIARPTDQQLFGMMAINVRRELIDALKAASYPTPTIDNVMALSALGVDAAYIGEMARAGYRPRTLDALVQFKALGITPEWIRGFVAIGYGDVPQDELVQLKAMNVTPEFITGFERIGYRHLSPDQLVQLKALDITPEFVRSMVGAGAAMPPMDQLVQLKLFGRVR
jgi:hypothetical protein